ncbi:MAG: hypothetical protein WDM79_15640 [Terricaulis sp.]
MGHRHLKFALLALGASLGAACATPAEEQAPPAFVVLEPNAHVYLSQVQVRGWGRDNSILLQTSPQHLVPRGVLGGGCTQKGSPSPIGFVTQTGDVVERGSRALIEGETCYINSFDRIEPPPPGSRS